MDNGLTSSKTWFTWLGDTETLISRDDFRVQGFFLLFSHISAFSPISSLQHALIGQMSTFNKYPRNYFSTMQQTIAE